MAQFYTLEEAARVLGMSPEDLKLKAQHREVRAFMDSGSWQFRVGDVDELARRRGMGSDPDLSLSDMDLDVPAGSGSDEFDLSEFQLGTDQADLGARSLPNLLSGSDAGDDEADVQFDDLTLPAGPLSNSSSTIIGMKPAGKVPSDSDVRLVPDNPIKDASDSDVRLMPFEPRHPGDAKVTLVNDDEGSLPDFDALSHKTPIGGSRSIGSSAEIAAAEGDSGSDFELTPSSNIAAALQPESGSDFELTALDASDEFEATPLVGPSDSDVTAALPSASGINLARPSDSGINLQGVGGFDLSDDSIELAPLDDDDAPARPAPKKAVPPAPAATNRVRPADPGATSLGMSSKEVFESADPGATSLGMAEKDIFEDTDFSLEVDPLDGDRDDRTVQLDRSSDFDLDDESDSASEVFALDEDDVDQNAATAMGAAMAAPDEDEDDFASSSGGGGGASSGWDVESDMGASPSTAAGTAVSTGRMVAAGPQAEWGGIWVGLLGVTSVLVLTSMIFSIDLIRNLYEFKGEGPASGLIKGLAGFFG